MVYVIVKHTISDIKKWRRIFDEAAEIRKLAGEKSSRIFLDKHNLLIGIFDFEDEETAREFLASDEVKAKMKEAGVIDKPEFYYMKEV